jgi:hypothetical protein
LRHVQPFGWLVLSVVEVSSAPFDLLAPDNVSGFAVATPDY